MRSVNNKAEMNTNNAEKLRLHLQNIYLKKVKENPSFSLRAFARFLQIDHSNLSKILKGQKPLSKKFSLKIMQKLEWTPLEINQFFESKQNSQKEEKTFSNLSLETFLSISDWYHDAILELIKTKDFKPDPRWIAHQLGITVGEVHIAIERLQKLSLLEITSEGKWITHALDTTIVSDELTSVAQRKYQKQMLSKASEAIDLYSKKIRNHSSITMAIDKNQMQEAFQEIKRFRRQMSRILEQSNPGSRDDVYQLSIAFFPLTQTQLNSKQKEKSQ